MKNLNKLLVLFVLLFVFSSCTFTKSVLADTPLTKLEVQTTSVVYGKEIVQEDKIGSHGLFQKTKGNELLLGFDTGVVKANDIIMLFTSTQFYTKAIFYYKDKKQKIRFTYLFDETDSFGDWGNESLYEPQVGNFSGINIKGLPKKYNFDVIDPYIQKVRRGSPLENTLVTQEELPLILTSFSIDEKPFKVVLTKMPEKQSVSIRSLIRYQEQEALIIDENCNVFASFNTDNYKIYDQSLVTPEELIVPIGVYTGLFMLLNKY